MILAVLFIGMFTSVLIGVPIAWALGMSGFWSLLLLKVPLSTVPQKIINGMDAFILMCIPLFILAGEIMSKGGITRRLLNFALNVVGFIRGGLALASVVASMIFAGITGSAIADASAIGSVAIPMMVKSGYEKKFAAAVIAAAGCIGPIIPPSITVVVYTMAVSGASVGALFAAGMIPGILIGIALMVTSFIMAVSRQYPKREHRISIRDFLVSVKDALLALLAPVIILGGIIGGIFTPTEAASVAVIYAFVVSFFVYKELKLSDLPGMFLRSAVTAAIVMIIIGTSNVFGLVISFEQLALKLKALLTPLGRFGFILTINVIFLIVGTFMDQNPAILILAPIFAPIAVNLGIHPIQFGMIIIINLVIGLITPPLGEVLFVVSPIAGVTIEEVVKDVLPFMLVEIAVLLLVSYIPAITLFIPRLLGYLAF